MTDGAYNIKVIVTYKNGDALEVTREISTDDNISLHGGFKGGLLLAIRIGVDHVLVRPAPKDYPVYVSEYVA